MQGDDHILEEYDMFISQRHCETTDDGGKDVQQLGCPVELVGFVDQRVEAFVNGLSDHLSAGYQLSNTLSYQF
jgi:cell division protein FtsW (lipid II flippase)